MGLRFLKRFSEADWGRVDAARKAAPFTSMNDVAIRAGLETKAMTAIAKAGGFESLEIARRSAVWEVPGAVSDARVPLPLSSDGQTPAFPPLDDGEAIAWDYWSARHSVRGHPVASLRPMLEKLQVFDARTVQKLSSGTRAHYAGLVTARQRPATASKVTFMTLEDETGIVNLVLWDRVFQEFSVLARLGYWLGVTGTIESQHNVVHLIVERLWVPPGPAPAHVASRDFH